MLKLKIKIIRFFKLIRYKRICKALGLEQRNDLTAYVMDGDETILGGGRRNGKTTACMVLAMVWMPELTLKACKHFTYDKSCGYCLSILFGNDPDYAYDLRDRCIYYWRLLQKSVAKCQKAGIWFGRKSK